MTSTLPKHSMIGRVRTARTLAMALAPLLVAAAPAWAALGGDVASVNADGVALKAEVNTTAMVRYDVHTITHDGLAVHEYSTRQGQVFAVTWQGPFKPDLHQLLGDYFSRYQSSAAAAGSARAGMHRQFNISRPDLVVESSGRLRGFHGLAYVPSLVPAGVSVQELQ